MEILLILLLLFFAYLFFTNNKQSPMKKEPCKPHRWAEHKQPDGEDTYLMCSQCDKTPTQIVEGY